MNILIAGASGFIGRNVLLGFPHTHEIHAIYNRSVDFPKFLKRYSLDFVRPIRCDLCDVHQIARAGFSPTGYDSCIYLAANGDPAFSVKEPGKDLCANTLALIQLVQVNHFEQFIFFSSGAVYDGLTGPVKPGVLLIPGLPYAISKLSSEYYGGFFQKNGHIKHLLNIRFFGAYGPWEPERKIYSRLVDQFAIRRTPQFIIRGDGRNLIDAMFVEDVVQALRLMVERSKLDGTYDLAMQRPLSLRELVQRAAQVFGLDAEIIYEGRVPEYIEFYTEDESLKRELNFSPRTEVEDGLMRLFEFKSNHHAIG